MADASATPSGAKAPREVEIKVRLPNIDEFFVSFDPSPLVERDIDNAIEEFIVESAMDAPRGSRFKLILQLPPEACKDADPKVLATSIENYFAFMRDREGLRVRRLLRDGRQALVIGLLFLGVCMGLGQAAQALMHAPAGAVIREGLVIVGWVANWRPIEIFLYDWRPMRRLQQVYGELANVGVEIRPTGPV